MSTKQHNTIRRTDAAPFGPIGRRTLPDWACRWGSIVISGHFYDNDGRQVAEFLRLLKFAPIAGFAHIFADRVELQGISPHFRALEHPEVCPVYTATLREKKHSKRGGLELWKVDESDERPGGLFNAWHLTRPLVSPRASQRIVHVRYTLRDLIENPGLYAEFFAGLSFAPFRVESPDFDHCVAFGYSELPDLPRFMQVVWDREGDDMGRLDFRACEPVTPDWAGEAMRHV